MKQVKVNLKSRKPLPKYTDEELTFLAVRVGLTLEQLKVVQAAAYATYQYIGSDLAEANGGKLMKRADMVEVVLDANYIEAADDQRGLAGRKLTPELREWLNTKASKFNLDYVYQAVGAAFSFPDYE